MNKRITLRVLRKIEKVLIERGTGYVYGDDSWGAGLCDLIPNIFYHLYPNHSRKPKFEIRKWLIPEFNKEYCCTIAPSTGDEMFWWNTNYAYGTNYDVESRLKVINHLIKLYSDNDTKTNTKCIICSEKNQKRTRKTR